MSEHVRARLIGEAEAGLARTITRLVGLQVELGHIHPDRAQDAIERHKRDALEIAQSTTDAVPHLHLHVSIEWVTNGYRRRADALRARIAERREGQ